MDQSWNKKRQNIRNECAGRGIDIRQQGKAYRLTGVGVDMMVTDLSWVSLSDLLPAIHARHSMQMQRRTDGSQV